MRLFDRSLVIDLPEREAAGEFRAFAVFAVDGNCAAVKLYKDFDERESDAGAVLLLRRVSLVVCVKYFLHVLFLDTCARIGHLQDKRRCFLREPDVYFPVLRSEFDGVGKQVEHDAFHFLRVESYVPVALSAVEREVYVPALRHLLERIGPVGDTVAEVGVDDVQLELSAVKLPDIEYLVNQAEQDMHVFVRDVEDAAFRLRNVAGFLQNAYRVGNQGEGSAEIVGNAGEEREFGGSRRLHLFPLPLQLLRLPGEQFRSPYFSVRTTNNRIMKSTIIMMQAMRNIFCME